MQTKSEPVSILKHLADRKAAAWKNNLRGIEKHLSRCLPGEKCVRLSQQAEVLRGKIAETQKSPSSAPE